MFVQGIRSGLALLAASIAPGLPAPGPAVLAPSAVASTHANEADAIRTLRKIAAAEQAFHDAVDIDTNCDREGEYGFLAELAGTQPMRVSQGCVPAAGTQSDLLVPALLPAALGHVPGPMTYQGFLAPYKGYYFQVWLAGTSWGGIVAAIPEDLYGGKMAAPFPDPVNSARYWIAYAWPIDHGTSGVRAFCVNQRGFVLECANDGSIPFDGLHGMPWFDEALSATADLSSPLRVGVPGGAYSTVWQPVH